jgi:hypothetical protein
MSTLAATPDRTLADLVYRRQVLEQRLIEGWKRIDAALAAGRDVAAWEQCWVALLAEYEQVCDAIRDAA